MPLELGHLSGPPTTAARAPSRAGKKNGPAQDDREHRHAQECTHAHTHPAPQDSASHTPQPRAQKQVQGQAQKRGHDGSDTWWEATHWPGKVSPRRSSIRHTFLKASRRNYVRVHFPGEDSGSERGSDLPKSTQRRGEDGAQGHRLGLRPQKDVFGAPCPKTNGLPAPALSPPRRVLATWPQHPGSPLPHAAFEKVFQGQ